MNIAKIDDSLFQEKMKKFNLTDGTDIEIKNTSTKKGIIPNK